MAVIFNNCLRKRSCKRKSSKTKRSYFDYSIFLWIGQIPNNIKVTAILSGHTV